MLGPSIGVSPGRLALACAVCCSAEQQQGNNSWEEQPVTWWHWLIHVWFTLTPQIHVCTAIMLSKACSKSGIKQGEEYRGWSLLCDSKTMAASSDQRPLRCFSACYPWSWMSCTVLALHEAFLMQTPRAVEPKLAWTKSFSVQLTETDSPVP